MFAQNILDYKLLKFLIKCFCWICQIHANIAIKLMCQHVYGYYTLFLIKYAHLNLFSI